MPAQTRIAAARSHAATEPVCTHAALARIRRALLLERAFQIDLECPICGGALNIRAAIIEMPVIKRIHSPTRIVTLALRTAAFGPRAYKFAGLLRVDFRYPVRGRLAKSSSLLAALARRAAARGAA